MKWGDKSMIMKYGKQIKPINRWPNMRRFMLVCHKYYPIMNLFNMTHKAHYVGKINAPPDLKSLAGI